MYFFDFVAVIGSSPPPFFSIQRPHNYHLFASQYTSARLLLLPIRSEDAHVIVRIFATFVFYDYPSKHRSQLRNQMWPFWNCYGWSEKAAANHSGSSGNERTSSIDTFIRAQFTRVIYLWLFICVSRFGVIWLTETLYQIIKRVKKHIFTFVLCLVYDLRRIECSGWQQTKCKKNRSKVALSYTGIRVPQSLYLITVHKIK